MYWYMHIHTLAQYTLYHMYTMHACMWENMQACRRTYKHVGVQWVQDCTGDRWQVTGGRWQVTGGAGQCEMNQFVNKHSRFPPIQLPTLFDQPPLPTSNAMHCDRHVRMMEAVCAPSAHPTCAMTRGHSALYLHPYTASEYTESAGSEN